MINLLKFNKKYYTSIIDGVKKQTIRKHNKRLKPGEKVKAIFPGTDDEVMIEITDVGYKQFKFIDETDAKLEGYADVNELKTELLNYYPLLDAMTRIYWIRFKVVD